LLTAALMVGFKSTLIVVLRIDSRIGRLDITIWKVNFDEGLSNLGREPGFGLGLAAKTASSHGFGLGQLERKGHGCFHTPDVLHQEEERSSSETPRCKAML
jgi:hypothetical protein